MQYWNICCVLRRLGIDINQVFQSMIEEDQHRS